MAISVYTILETALRNTSTASKPRATPPKPPWSRSWSRLAMQKPCANCMPAISAGNSHSVELRLSWGSPCASYMTFSNSKGSQHKAALSTPVEAP
jgi:hypothetical protein